MGKRATFEDWEKHRPGMVTKISGPGNKGQESGIIIPDSATIIPESSRTIPETAIILPKSAKESNQALGRLRSGEMNKTEGRYAQHLETQKAAGLILWYAFEPVNLRLGHDCFYSVDFLVLKADRSIEAHEVKGYWTDDALVKIRVAAEKFPFAFIAVQWKKGQWEYRHF